MNLATKTNNLTIKVRPINLGTKKICKTGQYTCTLSLPKVWMQNTGLKVGDRVDVEMIEDGSLVVRPSEKK